MAERPRDACDSPTRLSEDFLSEGSSLETTPREASGERDSMGGQPSLRGLAAPTQRSEELPHENSARSDDAKEEPQLDTQRSAEVPGHGGAARRRPVRSPPLGVSSAGQAVAAVAALPAFEPVRDRGLCLDDDAVLAFAQGLLVGEELERAELHIDICAECRQLTSEAMRAVDPLPASDEGIPAEFRLLRRGDIVANRYRILRFLACGGMGEVYEAYDAELGERVALKSISPGAGDLARAVRYLKAEVQLARRVSHANVCRTLEFGTHYNPRTGFRIHYLTMEFVEGESLGSHLRRHGPLPLLEAKRLAVQILNGLSAAHRAGVLHRDLKTDNVLLRQATNGTQALLSDFGLARALDVEGPISRHSSHGWVGTPDYMAPEQLEGKALSVASDLYAFGLVFFEMLTGKLPFPRCKHAVALQARLNATPSAPSQENEAIPEAWDHLILRCLERDPRQRFASADEVLQRLLESSLAPQKRAPRSLRRQSLVLASCALALVAVVGGLWRSRAVAGGIVERATEPRRDVEAALPSHSELPPSVVADSTIGHVAKEPEVTPVADDQLSNAVAQQAAHSAPVKSTSNSRSAFNRTPKAPAAEILPAPVDSASSPRSTAAISPPPPAAAANTEASTGSVRVPRWEKPRLHRVQTQAQPETVRARPERQ